MGKTSYRVGCLIAEEQKGEYLNQKKLDQVIGLLVYISINYKVMTPYLKVVHLKIDRWRRGRDEYGCVWLLSCYCLVNFLAITFPMVVRYVSG